MENTENIAPRANSFLLGQEQAEQVILEAWKSHKMHHAWLICGPKGCGKATLAYRIARFLFAAQDGQGYASLFVAQDSSIFKQVAECSYPDLKVLERSWTETDRKKIIKAVQNGEILGQEDLADFKKSAFIKVDEVREAADFLSKTAYQNGWKVVIIDSVDDMNKNSANALLKILEEPSAKTVLLLVCHNGAKILPTIRSRCAKLNLHPLKEEQVESLLRRYRPQLDENKIMQLGKLSCGSIGKAISYADNEVLELYGEFLRLVGSSAKESEILDFCADVSKNEDKFVMLEELAEKYFKELIFSKTNVENAYEIWQKTKKMFADCTDVNMDKNLMLIDLIHKIRKLNNVC